MKAKIKDQLVRLQTAIRRNPVEVVLSLFFCILGCASFESEIVWLKNLWPCFPFLFLTTYTLHQYILKKNMRLIYYLSAFFFIPFIWITFEIWSARYLVTLVVIQLVYLVSCWKKSNDLFVQFSIRYVGSVLFAWTLSTIAWVLSISIYMSIRYIFEIWETEESRFLTYAAAIAYLSLFPLLFLMFSQDMEEKEWGWGNNRLFDVLLNYVLSPALLIYAAILYLYFIKIAVLWSLPKGAVAYIVVSFVSATFILKGCQVFLSRRYYDWFYRHASLVVLPALVMYWVGTYYRIHEYGFTEPRVYLVVVGLILTVVMGLFFYKRSGHYLYAASVAIVLLSVVTYIPGITAKDIEIASQLARGNYPPKEEPGITTSYVDVETNLPVTISGFRSLQTVENYELQDNMWIDQENDSLYLYDGKKELYRESLDVLSRKQLIKAGLSPADTIPVSAYPALLQLDMDSAALVFKSMILSRYSTYKITYLNAGYYLEK